MTFREVMKRAMAKCRRVEADLFANSMPNTAAVWREKRMRIASRYEREPVRAAEEAERHREESEARREDLDKEAWKEMRRG